MKICWNNLEKLRYSKKTRKWYKKTNTYIYMESCKECKEPYLSTITNKDDFCSHSCANKNTSTTHGMFNTSTYSSWEAMKLRCLNPNSKYYKNYGGRSITVCERWMKFENFFADMDERPKGYELHRIDNDKGYFPTNCEWKDRILHRLEHK